MAMAVCEAGERLTAIEGQQATPRKERVTFEATLLLVDSSCLANVFLLVSF